MPDRICSVADCSRTVECRGLCNAHYKRAREGRPLDAPVKDRAAAYRGADCSVANCLQPAIAKEMCNAHYRRSRKGSPIDAPMKARSDTCDRDRWLAKVVIPLDDPDACWGWLGSAYPSGYGMVHTTNGRDTGAHRLSWLIHHGVIPDDMCVLHACDNPPCSNPRHLFLGSRADNSADMVSKGRQACGERLRQAKLTATDVQAIRSSTESNVTLAERYGVNPWTIYDARTGRTWQHLDQDFAPVPRRRRAIQRDKAPR